MERFKDFDFFNWSNSPWVGLPGTQWQIPGLCVSGVTHTLSLNTTTHIERPWKVLWQNSVGLRKPWHSLKNSGSVRLQLFTWSPDNVLKKVFEDTPTFKVLMEREIPVPVIPSNNAKWHYMTEEEKDVMMACPHSGGFQFGMRFASNDSELLPIISYSRIGFQYDK